MGPCWLQRILTVLDEFTRECLAIHVARSIRSADLIQVLEWLFLTRGVPEHIRSDNGPEFVAEATRRWLGRQEVATIFITPGSPWENPFIESFNGTLRDHCLNMYAFVSIRDANAIVEDWRWEYSHHRPHSSLSGMPPAAFAASAATPLRPTASAPLQRREKTVATLSN
jgi:transposase InsO family protein